MVDQVTLPDGTVVTDDVNPTTGIRNGGHQKFFIKCLSAVVTWLSQMQAYVAQVQAYVAQSQAAAGSAGGTIFPIVTAADAGKSLVINSAGDAYIVNSSSPGFKNKLLNGCFSLWQRGVSFSAVTNLYTADRWYAWGAQSNVTISQVLRAVGNGSTYALQFAASSTANAFQILQALESNVVDTLKGRTVTLSFYGAAASGTQTINFVIYKNSTANTSSAGWQVLASKSVTLTTAMQRFSITAIVPADGTNGLAASIYAINIASGINFQVFDFQLEEGSVATTFDRRNYTFELILCKRYFNVLSAYVPAYPVRNQIPIYMRSTPTVVGGGAGFGSAFTNADVLVVSQTSEANQILQLNAEL